MDLFAFEIELKLDVFAFPFDEVLQVLCQYLLSLFTYLFLLDRSGRWGEPLSQLLLGFAQLLAQILLPL